MRPCRPEGGFLRFACHRFGEEAYEPFAFVVAVPAFEETVQVTDVLHGVGLDIEEYLQLGDGQGDGLGKARCRVLRLDQPCPLTKGAQAVRSHSREYGLLPLDEILGIDVGHVRHAGNLRGDDVLQAPAKLCHQRDVV